jgi:transposase
VLIESTGANLIFLPPYSPLLNPIENAWSKIKNHLKHNTAKTERSLCTAIKKALNTITKTDCFNWFRGCDYGVQ